MPERENDAEDGASSTSLAQVDEETQNLPSAVGDANDSEIYDFASSFGLTEHIEVLQRAVLLLKHDGVTSGQAPGTLSADLKALERETSHRWNQPYLLYFTIFVCALGAIEQGWAQTGMNGANLYLPAALQLDTNQGNDGPFLLGLINCAMYLSNALFGCWLSEPLNNSFGRRGAMFAGNVLCLIGNLGSALVPSARSSVGMLVVFRLILGTGLGLNASTVSVYAAESAPSYIRGGLAVSWQMFVAFGILLGFFANVAFYNFDQGLIWRLQLAAPLLPALPLLILIYYCPESPFWYVKRSRYDLAWSSLRRLRNTDIQAAIELLSIRSGRESTFEPSQSRPSGFSFSQKLRSLITTPRNRNALVASYVVMLSQQLCGINIIAFYSSTIFSSPGRSMLSALWASVVFGLVNFLGAFPAVWTMDSFGRRRLLLWTLPPMALTMALISFVLTLPEGTDNTRFALLAGLIYIFCALYSPGMGPVPCAYSAEVYPLNVREIGMSVAISTANAWATILSLTLPALLSWLGEQGVFALYAALNVLAWALCWLFVRETKGVRLEDMDAVFSKSCTRFITENWQGGWLRSSAKLRSAGGHAKLPQSDPEEDDANPRHPLLSGS